MRPIPKPLLALLLLLASTPGLASRLERGYPLIQPRVPDHPEAESQSFGIAADSRGVLYIANLAGVLVHDGAWWRLVEIGAARSAFSLATDATDATGRVGVGGIDELGYLEAGPDGALRYVSLVPHLPAGPAGQRDLGQVMQVHPTADGFVYMTARRLLAWDGKTFHTVATFPGDRPYAASFRVGRTILVWTREGLMQLAGARLEPVPGGEAFRGRRVDLVLPAGPAHPADTGLLVSVREEGLFLLRDGLTEPFAPEASRWAAEHRLLDGLRLPDGRWALGSILGGILLLRPDGSMDQEIGTASGLPDDFIAGLDLDREGALWVALNNGLARVEVGSPLSVLDARSGLKGSVYHVARHRGELWAATSAGVFRTEPGAGPLRMRAVPGLPPSGWSLLSRGEDLLAGTAFGVYLIRGESARALPGIGQRTAFVLAPSPADPERVWVGTEDGLAAIRREGGEWRYEGPVAGVSGEVRAIVESAGAVWCGTDQDGIVKVELPAGWPASGRPRVRAVPGSAGALPRFAGGRILANREDRLLRLDEARGALVEDPALQGLNGDFYVLTEDARGNLWRNTRPVSVGVREGSRWSLRSLVEVPARGVESIVAEPDGVVWLASEAGLFRYEGSPRAASPGLPAPWFGRMTVDGGTVLFGGAPRAVPPSPELPADARRLRIELSPLSFRAGLRYQTRLDPVDPGWSEPAPEPFAELTRLPPGAYTFRARTVGPSGETGPETEWAFQVLPPWYRTRWALALWAALALVTLTGFSWLRSRALRRRAARLETRVAAQTEELRKTMAELQLANDELEVANERLEQLSLEDALTGVANRRHLHQVLEEEWSRARRSRKPVAFLLLDLDHFKLLNDTRGHGEGDRCLQTVARFLAGVARRPSDLVARYGGEEFAFLFPETTLSGALELAEHLRQGVEALGIPNLAAPLGRVTASLGVAVMIPEPGQRVDDLVEAADSALYQAKDQGRNRVRAAEPAPRPTSQKTGSAVPR